MKRHTVDTQVLGPWSLTTSRAFWEGFSPSALGGQRAGDGIRTVFRVETDWSRAEAQVTQREHLASISLAGDGDLQAAADQVRRFLSLDVDARGWPDVAPRDPVIADAQAQLPGLRPCGFHSPYEAAAWSVLSQRIRIVQAARLRRDLVDRYGDDGASRPRNASAPWTSTCPAARPNTCMPSPTPRSTGASTGPPCGPSTPPTPSDRSRRSRGWGRSRPSWWYCVAPTRPTSCPATSSASTLRSSSGTARAGHLQRSPRPGVPTEPGPQSTSAHCASNAPTRSADPTATDITYVVEDVTFQLGERGHHREEELAFRSRAVGARQHRTEAAWHVKRNDKWPVFNSD